MPNRWAVLLIGFAGIFILFCTLVYTIYMSAEMPRSQYERVFSDLYRYPQMQELYDRMMMDGEMSRFEFRQWHYASIIEYRKWYIKNQYGVSK